MTYAKDTKVPVSRTRDEIERTLRRYGAEAFAYGWADGRSQVEFHATGRRVRITVPMVDVTDQQERARWRAVLLVIKAKLEAIEAGISTFEAEFLANVVLPNGRTVGEWAAPQLEVAYADGNMPALLPGSAA